MCSTEHYLLITDYMYAHAVYACTYANSLLHSPQPDPSVTVLVFGDSAALVYPCLNLLQHLQRQRERKREGKFSIVFHN